MALVEIHFDFGSPNAYLSHLVIPEIERRTGAKFVYVPVLLGGVFKLTNNRSPGESMAGIRNKPEYQWLEMARFLRRHGITRFTMNPFFPVNTLAAMRGAIAAERLGVFERYVDEVFRHMWAEPKKLDDPAIFHAALMESGLDADQLVALTQSPEVKEELLANTQRSVERGTFGSPTFFVGDEIFFGKDRLRDVEEAISLTELFVDADACPVRDEIYRVAGRLGLSVHLVSNGSRPFRPPGLPNVTMVSVPDGADAADDWIAERIGPADVCVTSDIPLAARCLARGAQAVAPNGHAWTKDNIGNALAGREVARHLREIGATAGGPAPLAKADRSKFLSALDAAITRARRMKPA